MTHSFFREGFGKELIVLAFPIVIQNLITSSVQLADTVMLGRLSQTALSASSLAGQVGFILFIIYFGLSSALTILASQYWGKQDTNTIGKIFGIGLYISIAISFSAFLLCFSFPSLVMRFWTNVTELVQEGAIYLRIVAFSYLFLSISQPYLAIMRSCERVRLSTIASSSALLLNVVLNALLIFGLLGFPRLGIRGAAIATVVSRSAELLICLWDYARQSILEHHIAEYFRIPKALVDDFKKYCMPALINDVLWVFAYNMNSVIMGHLGSDMVAASSVVGVARELVAVVGFGISSAAAIMLGKEIGEGNRELAQQDADAILLTTFLVTVVQGVVLYLLRPFIKDAVILSDTASHYLMYMLTLSCFYQVLQVLNTLLIASIFRCGGDTRYGVRLDLLSMWGITVPLGLISAFVLKLPPLTVYTILCIDEVSKFPFALFHYKGGSWNRNLTREEF
ncbi:MAG: MATE family efflux transporter [Solobacterium sp.]|nr:MATE family efflux transporter [Solobacterium sp.]